MRKYAVVVSSDGHYMPGTVALFNSLELFGNEVDVHFLPTPDVPKEILAQLPDHYYVIDWNNMPFYKITDYTNRGLPWQVRFFRYWHMARICGSYRAVTIMDADCFVLGNIMDQFEMAERTGKPVMVENPFGMSDYAKLPFIDAGRAQLPPFLGNAAFYAPSYMDLFWAVFENGLAEPISDMPTLFQTMLRQGIDLSDIVPLKNETWCFTKWWDKRVEYTEEGGAPVIRVDGERMMLLHGKWFMDAWIDAELKKDYCRDPERGAANAQIFRKVVQWINEHGRLKLNLERSKG